jgi:hypothetical protein
MTPALVPKTGAEVPVNYKHIPRGLSTALEEIDDDTD